MSVTTAPAATIAATISIDPVGRSGPENMARDVALMQSARPGLAAIRLYRWEPFCLSFGRHENALTRYDQHRIASLGFAVVRRPTGGRAVWHADEVTYAVAGHVNDFGSLRSTYRWIHGRIVVGLERLGLRAALASGRPAPAIDAGACFASPVGGEVVVGGRKLVGSAQVRDGDRFLQHGSILLSETQGVVASVSRGRAATVTATGVRQLAGRAVTFEELAVSIAHGFEGGFERVTASAVMEADPRDLAHFENPDWTWRR